MGIWDATDGARPDTDGRSAASLAAGPSSLLLERFLFLVDLPLVRIDDSGLVPFTGIGKGKSLLLSES